MIVAHALTEATVDDATVGIDLIGAAASILSRDEPSENPGTIQGTSHVST